MSAPPPDTRSWYDWFWGLHAPAPQRAADAAHSDALRTCFARFLERGDGNDGGSDDGGDGAGDGAGAFFTANAVARALPPDDLEALGYDRWKQAVPGVLELALELREFGDCELWWGGACRAAKWCRLAAERGLIGRRDARAERCPGQRARWRVSHSQVSGAAVV